MRRLIY